MNNFYKAIILSFLAVPAFAQEGSTKDKIVVSGSQQIDALIPQTDEKINATKDSD